MVCGWAAANTPRTQKQTEWNETRNCTNSVVALQDQCSYKAPTTNHHIKKKTKKQMSYLQLRELPCFPDNNTGLILNFTLKFTPGLIFGDVLYWYVKKWSYKVKIKRFLNLQKLRKTIYICLSLTCFLFKNSLTTIYSKTIISLSSGMSWRSSVSKIPAEFSLNAVSHQSTRPYFKGRAYILKSSSKITLSFIIG